MKKNIVAIIPVFAFLFFGIGFWFGYVYGNNSLPSKSGAKNLKEDTFEAGWLSAKEKIEKSNILPLNSEVKSLLGTVVSINNSLFGGVNEIKFNTDYKPKNPLAELPPQERIAKIDKNTVFIDRVIMSAQEFSIAQQKYMEKLNKYREALANGEKNITQPAPLLRFIDNEIKFSQIKNGDKITVYNSKENLEYQKEFLAETVYVIRER